MSDSDSDSWCAVMTKLLAKPDQAGNARSSTHGATAGGPGPVGAASEVQMLNRHARRRSAQSAAAASHLAACINAKHPIQPTCRSAASARPATAARSNLPSCSTNAEKTEFAPNQYGKMSLWSLPIMKAMHRAAGVRGRQQRPVIVGSLCSGLAPEETALHEFKLRTRVVFTCDAKAASVNFVHLNSKPEHNFIDMRGFQNETKSCKCSIHGFRECPTTREELPQLDVLTAGISCKPYALCRTGRRAEDGVTAVVNHRDVWMAECFLSTMLRLQPTMALLENVMGFALATKVAGSNRFVSTSPLRGFLSRFEQLGLRDQYSVQVYAVSSQPFLHQLRRRVYIQMVKASAGGDEANALADRLFQDCCVFVCTSYCAVFPKQTMMNAPPCHTS